MNAIVNTAQPIVDAITIISRSAAQTAVEELLQGTDALTLNMRVDDLNHTSNGLVARVEAAERIIKALEDEGDSEDSFRRHMEGFELVTQEVLDDAVREMEKQLENFGDDLPSADDMDDLKNKVDELESAVEGKADQEEMDSVTGNIRAIELRIEELEASQSSQAISLTQAVGTVADHEEQITRNSQKVVDLEMRLDQMGRLFNGMHERVTKLEQDNLQLRVALSGARQALLGFTVTAEPTIS